MYVINSLSSNDDEYGETLLNQTLSWPDKMFSLESIPF